MPLPLFYAQAAGQALSFISDLQAANDQNDYLEAVRKAQEVNAASQAAAEVEGVAARAIQTQKATALRLDELQRFARKGVAASQAASVAGGVLGATGRDAELDFKARISEKLAADVANLKGEEEQIQRMLDAVPIQQSNAVKAVQGVTPPSIAGASLGILGSYFEIDAKFG